MAVGPGKYDTLATIVRVGSNARAVAVIVIGGYRGDGFAVQAPLEDTLLLPTLLRKMADEIEMKGPEA